ncbi:MAG: hypothetical protein R6W69_06040, partial [Anaerolineales bacterium]
KSPRPLRGDFREMAYWAAHVPPNRPFLGFSPFPLGRGQGFGRKFILDLELLLAQQTKKKRKNFFRFPN